MQTPEYSYCFGCGGVLEPRVVKAAEPPRLVCVDCERIHYLDPKLAAGIVVETATGVLLVQRAIEPQYGKWVFPGGYVDRGESPASAAVREAHEEAGVEVEVEGLLGVYHLPAGSPVVMVAYYGRIVGGEPKALDETLAVATFSSAALPWKDLAFPTTVAALRDYVAR